MKKIFISLCIALILALSPAQVMATVSSTDNKIIYVGDGSTTIFPYNFKIFQDTDLVVNIVITATGVATKQTITTNYSVSGVGVAAGGNVTMVATPASTEKLVIQRVLPLTQGTDLVDNTSFSLEVLEEGYDRSIMIAQQQQESLDRVLIQSITETTQIEFPSPVANNIIGWDSGGTTLENKSGLAASVTAAEDAQAAAELAESGTQAAAAAAATSETNAETAETNAAASAASINLPTISGGDENKILEVKATEDGYELTNTPTFATLELTGGQISFPASQSASADPNTQDDYEEGTWTSGITFGGGTTGISYATVAGRYQKVGDWVSITGVMTLTDKGSSSGVAIITGLPFVSKNVDGALSPTAFQLFSVSFADFFMGSVEQNKATIQLFEITNAGVRSSIVETNFSNTSHVSMSATYQTQ